MADIALVQRPSGKYDFLVSRGNVVRTGQLVPVAEARPCAIDPGVPALLRLLLQGEWIGDDGERFGKSLADIRFLDSETQDLVTQIVAVRSSSLIPTYFSAVTVLRVYIVDTQLYVSISYQRKGQQPQTVQVPLRG